MGLLSRLRDRFNRHRINKERHANEDKNKNKPSTPVSNKVAKHRHSHSNKQQGRNNTRSEQQTSSSSSGSSLSSLFSSSGEAESSSSFKSKALEGEMGTTQSGSGFAGIGWGAASLKGRRLSQQDAFVVGRPSGLYNTAMFGVFDGHGAMGGGRAARTAAKILPKIVSKHLAKVVSSASPSGSPERAETVRKQVSRALRDAFIEFDNELNSSFDEDDAVMPSTFLQWVAGKRDEKTGGYKNAGTCALVALVGPSKVYLANIGDSQAVARSGKLTKVHRSSEAEEARRIYWAGGYIANDRINGDLIPSRAFGDFTYKMGDHVDNHIVTCIPDVVEISRQELGKYLVLGSDGLFEALAPTEVMRLCDAFAMEEPEVIAQEIVDRAIEAGSVDNVTCVVICLECRQQPHQQQQPQPLTPA